MKAMRWGAAREQGFTLIEIAIVIVIVGLLLGGVLKGVELVQNAKVHNLADQGNAIKAALLGFQDRYKALPGDFARASDFIHGVKPEENGDGDGKVGGDPDREAGPPEEGEKRVPRGREIALAWLHLTKSGFLTGDFDGKAIPKGEIDQWSCSGYTCPVTAFNSTLMILYGRQQYSSMATVPPNCSEPDSWRCGPKGHQLLTGDGIPVEVMGELDRKLDDGDPASGGFRVGARYASQLGGDPGADCVTQSLEAMSSGSPFIDLYNVSGDGPPCGGVFLF